MRGTNDDGHDLYCYCNRLFYSKRSLRARLRQTMRRFLMVDYIWTGLAAAALLIYLLYALLKPERF